jgi:hypothetical protein
VLVAADCVAGGGGTDALGPTVGETGICEPHPVTSIGNKGSKLSHRRRRHGIVIPTLTSGPLPVWLLARPS